MVNHDRRTSLLESYANAAVIVSGEDAGDLGRLTPCPDDENDVAHLVDHIVQAGHRAATVGWGTDTPHPDTTLLT